MDGVGGKASRVRVWQRSIMFQEPNGKQALCLPFLFLAISAITVQLAHYPSKLPSFCFSRLSTSNIVRVAQYWAVCQKRTSGSHTNYTGNETHFPSFPHLIHNGSYGLRITAVYLAPNLLHYNESLLRRGEREWVIVMPKDIQYQIACLTTAKVFLLLLLFVKRAFTVYLKREGNWDVGAPLNC